jgi:hypothetical protein
MRHNEQTARNNKVGPRSGPAVFMTVDEMRAMFEREQPLFTPRCPMYFGHCGLVFGDSGTGKSALLQRMVLVVTSKQDVCGVELHAALKDLDGELKVLLCLPEKHRQWVDALEQLGVKEESVECCPIPAGGEYVVHASLHNCSKHCQPMHVLMVGCQHACPMYCMHACGPYLPHAHAHAAYRPTLPPSLPPPSAKYAPADVLCLPWLVCSLAGIDAAWAETVISKLREDRAIVLVVFDNLYKIAGPEVDHRDEQHMRAFLESTLCRIADAAGVAVVVSDHTNKMFRAPGEPLTLMNIKGSSVKGQMCPTAIVCARCEHDPNL